MYAPEKERETILSGTSMISSLSEIRTAEFCDGGIAARQ